MLTLFSCPKAFEGHSAVIQRNAFESWRRLGRDVEVLVFGDDHGTAAVAKQMDFAHFPDVAKTPFGTPLLDEIFRLATQHARHDVLCHVNADIVLRSDFLRAIGRIVDLFPAFLAVGQRVNLDIDTPLDFSGDWETKLARRIKTEGRVEPPDGIDFFAFTRASGISLPPFAVGRPCWDNWLIMDAQKRGIPIVDLTRVCQIVHQNHDYSHIPGRSGKGWEGPEADANRAIAKQDAPHFAPGRYTVLSAGWVLDAKGIGRMTPLTRWRRRLYHHPRWPDERYVKVAGSGLALPYGLLALLRRIPRGFGLRRRLRTMFDRLRRGIRPRRSTDEMRSRDRPSDPW